MLIASRRWLGAWVLWLFCGTAAGAISFAFGQSKNLEVYAHAARALLAGRPLYDGSSVDWFKYSPTFALLFVPLVFVPRWVAAVVWSTLNFGAAYLGIRAAAGDRARTVLVAALPGVLLATDGDQANLLVVGAMLGAFAAFEREKPTAGAALVALGTLTKIFPILAVLFAARGRDRERAFFRVAVGIAALSALPLVVVSGPALADHYASWIALLRHDHATRGWSIATVIRDAGGAALPVQVGMLALGLLPTLVAVVVPVDASFRRRSLAALLLVIVLCNHRSEYASYVIAAVAVAIWFAEGPPTPARIALVVVAAIAPGPFFTWSDAGLTGPLSFLAAHRIFHPLRLVPFVSTWLLLQRSLVVSAAASLRTAQGRA